jgi:ABC-type nitrate/sulfonate/bicarbonate transport system substrate-binding protein
MADERSCTRTIVALMVAAVTCLSLSLARADQRVRIAYISDSPGSSAPYWIAKEAGLYKKHGLDVELIFINGSTRGSKVWWPVT